jgi:hypothetical protein
MVASSSRLPLKLRGPLTVKSFGLELSDITRRVCVALRMSHRPRAWRSWAEVAGEYGKFI